MQDPPAPLWGHQAVGRGLLIPAPVAVSSVQCDSSTFCCLLLLVVERARGGSPKGPVYHAQNACSEFLGGGVGHVKIHEIRAPEAANPRKLRNIRVSEATTPRDLRKIRAPEATIPRKLHHVRISEAMIPPQITQSSRLLGNDPV